MKILYVTTISLTMNAFFKPHIEMLVREGHSVDLACNFNDMPADKLYSELGCNFYHIDFSRSPLSVDNIKAYGQLKKVVESGNYDIVHCHTPNASVITRLVCRKIRSKKGMKVFYTAHGFHFFKGASKLNWLVFYPVEKFCSRFTDKLITINKEDYELAKSRFSAKEVHYVPGVGIDLSRFENTQVDKKAKRVEIGVPQDATMLISVGELSARKNHKVILQSLIRLKNSNVYYVVVGQGQLLSELKSFADSKNISDRVIFLGQRDDVADLYKCADICCFPSIHEGLPVALMEAMACGLPVVCSRIRGNTDLINGDSGFLVSPYDCEGFTAAIDSLIENSCLREKFARNNLMSVKAFEKNIVIEQMSQLYR